MATFAYTARRIDGGSVSGSIPAESERAALGALDRLGLFPIDLRRDGDAAVPARPRATASLRKPEPEAATATAAEDTPGGGTTTTASPTARRDRATGRLTGPPPAAFEPTGAPALFAPPAEAEVSAGDDLLARLRTLLGTQIGAETAARFARELADLSQAGVPILKALDAVSHTPLASEGVIWGAAERADDERARVLLREVRRDVAQGSTLNEAIGRRPALFGTTAVSLIRAGEAGGFLDQALRRVAVFAERELALSRRVKGALAYPVVLMLLSLGAVVFLLTWVVPRFTVIYADLGGELPTPTKILMAAGAFLGTWWPLLVLAIGGAAVALGRFLSTEDGKRRRDALLLRLPLVRTVIGQACVARFCRTLGTLLGSGVPILKALEIAQGASGNRDFSARLGDTLAQLREGAGLAAPLRATRLFPPQVLETIEVGQETGGLVEVLERAGERADEEVDQSLKILVTVLEPTLIVGVASVVFFVVLAALLPVFTLNTMVH